MENVKTSESKSMGTFYAIWSAQAVSLLGSHLVGFALVWYLTDLTGSAVVLALASMMQMLPQIVLGPFAGALIDRWNRRVVLIVADSIIAIATLILAYLFLVGVVEIWHIYILMFVRSTAGGFHWAAMQASTSLMVPENKLPRINGLNQLLHGSMMIAAPPLGALLLDVLPMQGILAIDVVTAVIAITPLFFIMIPQPTRDGISEQEGFAGVLADMREGLTFIWEWKGLRLVLFLSMLLNFLVMPGMAVLPLLATDHFGGGALQLAWLEASFGLGMIAGGLLLSMWGGFKEKIFTGMLGVVGLGVGLLIVSAAPGAYLWVGVAGLLFASLCNAMANGILFSILQIVVPADKQGRVFTILVSGGSLMTPIGLAIGGPVVETFGVLSWFLIGGTAAVIMGIGGLFIPALRNMESDGEARLAEGSA
ncbi:MAG: MFS transporter [Anaerolineae bacterium]|nr:MFS transporter [Anaerolineae bacterium]